MDTQKLAEAVALDRLGYPLPDWVADQRETHSWQTVARLLSDLTDGLLNPSWETLRRWYA